MTYTRTATDVARIILAAGDGTFTLDGERVVEVDGFEVGGVDPDMPRDAREGDGGQLEARLADRITALREEVGQDTDLIRLGRWKDPKTGIIHLDATVHIPDLSVALGVGRVFEQVSIWDWANETTINCDTEEAS